MDTARHITASLPCAVCGNTRVMVVAKKDRRGKPLVNVLCAACGLVWVDPQPSGKDTERFYSVEYRKQYKGSFQPAPKHSYRETVRAIDRTLRFLSVYKDGMRVIDVGAGAGFFAYVLARRGITIDGIEPNEEYADHARSSLGLDTIRTGFLRDVPAENQYDMITINHVFEHLPDPRQAMTQMHRLLRKGGRVLMEVPNIEATYHAPNKIFHVGHLYWYNPGTIGALAIQSGFDISDVQLVVGTKHINLVLARCDESPASRVGAAELLAGNVERVLRVLQKHTMARHFMTTTPYTRFFRKMREYLGERAHVRQFNDSKAICDSVCDRWLADSSGSAANLVGPAKPPTF